MTCCGNLLDITTNDDTEPIFMCDECGKQGPESAFPDDPVEIEPEPAPVTWRTKAAGLLHRAANRINKSE